MCIAYLASPFFSQNLYLGSGNLGSRCTTRTKEIGMLASQCPSLALVTMIAQISSLKYIVVKLA